MNVGTLPNLLSKDEKLYILHVLKTDFMDKKLFKELSTAEFMRILILTDGAVSLQNLRVKNLGNRAEYRKINYGGIEIPKNKLLEMVNNIIFKIDNIEVPRLKEIICDNEQPS